MFTFLHTTPGCLISVSIRDPAHLQVLFNDFHVAGQESLFFSNSQHLSSALEGCFFPQFLHTDASLYFFLFCRASISSPHWLLWRLEFCSLSVGALFLSLPWLWSSRVFTSVACVLRWDLQSVLPLPLLVLASHWFWSVSLITCSACFP